METYLVEAFLPGGRVGSEIGTARLHGVRSAGRVLQMFALPDSELCLCLVEATSHEAATAVVRDAGLTVDGRPEIVEVISPGNPIPPQTQEIP